MIRQRLETFLHLIGLSVVTFLTITAATATTTTTNTQQPLHLNLPLGIFNLDSSQQSPNAISSPIPTSSYIDDDIDVYVPYRSDSHDQFSWQLLKQVLQEDSKNTVVSPFLVKLAVALLSEAAGNNTQTQHELINTLTDIRTPDNLRSYYKKILTSLKKENPNYTLNLETKIYTDAFVEPKQRFAAILQNYYYTDIARLPFDDPQQSAGAINTWCSNVTHGKLQQLVDVENVKNNIMLIVNVIYFNGLWKRQFNNTFSNVFFKTPSEQIKAEYMEQTEYFYYYGSPTLGAKILRLPYKGKSFSMFIILPTTNASLDELTQNLQNEQLKQMQWMMEEVKLKVTVPKFKFDYNKDLKSTLNHLGIQCIFTDNASLPGLARGADVAGKLKISNIFQKAGIDVNELGTEAYASTVVEIVNKFGGTMTIEEFNVNRPFIFFIEDELTGNILFAGKVIEPFV